jgi:hypothetical protein
VGEAPRDSSALEASMGSVQSAISELACSLDQLEMRANSVLRPSMPQPAQAGQNLKEVSPAVSPAVAEAHSHRSRLEQLTLPRERHHFPPGVLIPRGGAAPCFAPGL